MRDEDLAHSELLELDPEGGLIRFAGQRALLVDAFAMGLLRKNLVEQVGVAAARALLTQFGFAHGWRMAESIKDAFPKDGDDDWRRAGPRIHALQGLFLIQPGAADPLSRGGTALVASYEAEQHLVHFGQAERPCCWTISGLISGYMSKTSEREVYVLEDTCLACGDAACHFRGMTRAEWGDERADELRFFHAQRLEQCLDVSLVLVTKALKDAEVELHARRRVLARIVPEIDEPQGIVARSPSMATVVDVARRVAKVDSTVVITGESGSGKERLAALVHEESSRLGGPFIAVNCAALSDTLLESELFGHARGAFTGATHARPGLFEAAHGGTLFLDEIGEVTPAMQVKLLRALQERVIKRVGENKPRPVDLRVIAATNRDLAGSVDDGSFRKDLYYRLKVIELHVPPLRERRDDVMPLARLFLAQALARMKRETLVLSPGAADRLLRYAWPGNVRELENVMERAAALAQGNRVEVEDLPEEVRGAGPNFPPVTADDVKPLRLAEQEYILAALAVNEGNQTRTAKQLGIGSVTLYRKLKSYGLKPST